MEDEKGNQISINNTHTNKFILNSLSILNYDFYLK